MRIRKGYFALGIIFLLWTWFSVDYIIKEPEGCSLNHKFYPGWVKSLCQNPTSCNNHIISVAEGEQVPEGTKIVPCIYTWAISYNFVITGFIALWFFIKARIPS